MAIRHLDYGSPMCNSGKHHTNLPEAQSYAAHSVCSPQETAITLHTLLSLRYLVWTCIRSPFRDVFQMGLVGDACRCGCAALRPPDVLSTPSRRNTRICGEDRQAAYGNNSARFAFVFDGDDGGAEMQKQHKQCGDGNTHWHWTQPDLHQSAAINFVCVFAFDAQRKDVETLDERISCDMRYGDMSWSPFFRV